MENASTVVYGEVPVAEPDRGRFRAPVMGRSPSGSETRKSKDSAEHASVSGMPAPADSMHNRPRSGETMFTLRIKPDRRRAQAPMAPGNDRRRRR